MINKDTKNYLKELSEEYIDNLMSLDIYKEYFKKLNKILKANMKDKKKIEKINEITEEYVTKM